MSTFGIATISTTPGEPYLQINPIESPAVEGLHHEVTWYEPQFGVQITVRANDSTQDMLEPARSLKQIPEPEWITTATPFKTTPPTGN